MQDSVLPAAPTLFAVLTGIAIVLAGAHLVAVKRGMTALGYATKPSTTAAIVALAAAGTATGWYRGLVVAGLAASLAGDVFLMLPSDRFVAGLACFLCAHVLYTTAFATPLAQALSVAAAAPFAVLAVALFRALAPRLGAMRVPVAVYVVAIAAMAWQAASAFVAGPSAPRAAALAGACVFLVSDGVLAFDRFRAPMRDAQVVVMATYYTAQWLIAASVWR